MIDSASALSPILRGPTPRDARRRPSCVAALLLLSAGFAGCTSEGDSEADGSDDSVEQAAGSEDDADDGQQESQSDDEGQSAGSADDAQGADSDDDDSDGTEDDAAGTSDDGEPPVGEIPPEQTEGASQDVMFGGGADTTVTVGEDPAPPSEEPPGSEGEAEAEDEPAAPLVRCDAAIATGEAPLIDDFEDADAELIGQDGRAGGWYWYNSEEDAEQGFVIEELDDLPSGGSLAMHTWGSGYDWSGVGMGFHWSAPDENDVWHDCVYDASVYEGVRFWARGNGVELTLSISVPGVIPVDSGGTCEDACWGNHGVMLAIGEEWEEYVVPFSDFVQPDYGPALGSLDPRELRTLQFEFPGASNFELWVDDIGFYGQGAAPDDGDEPEEEAPEEEAPEEETPEEEAPEEQAPEQDGGAPTGTEDADAGAPSGDPSADEGGR